MRPPARPVRALRSVPALRAAAWALAAAGLPAVAAACELRAFEHRSGREVLRAPLGAAAAASAALPSSTPAVPELRVSFVHSVLGTPVEDRYQWRAGTWVLVEERFEGEGYGLPYAAGKGERLERTAGGWLLRLQRPIEPLVVRPLLAQRMRVSLDDGRSWLLGELSAQAVLLRAVGC